MEEKCNSLINSDIQMMVYQFTIFNPMIKVFPACHVPTPSSQRHKVILKLQLYENHKMEVL